MERETRVTAALRRCAALLVAAVVLAGCAAAPVEHAVPTPARSVHEPATAEADEVGEHPGDLATATEPLPVPGPGDVAAGLEAVRSFRSVRGHVETPPPATVRVPAIGVDSTLVSLGREPGGGVEVPGDWQRAGWFTEGARPGQPGPAVILGHVDSRDGPAVFFRLHELRPGDEVLVDRADGSTVRFTVDRVEHHDKDDFPTEAVYYPTLEPTLRLVTCGGPFDRRERSYRDNVIAFATQTP